MGDRHRVGVVGVGHLGQHHARLLAGLDNVELAGIVDINPSRAQEIADDIGYPLIIKASAGGGGRRMRIVRQQEELIQAFQTARNEAQQACGIPDG